MQEIDPLAIGGAIKITIEEFKTPKGNKIHEEGIIPDIEVENEKKLLRKYKSTDIFETPNEEYIFEVSGNFDLVYIDTPYISENGVGVDYADFYHFLNGLADYDNWKANIDYKSKHLRLLRTSNVWNEKEHISNAFERLFRKFSNSTMVISYRSNGIPTIEELVRIAYIEE